MEKNKIKKSVAVFATTLIVVIVGVASFAYFGTFDVNLINNVAVNINSSSPGNATFISNATELNLQVPAANMSQTVADNSTAAASNAATLTVNLTGAKDLLTTCTYDVVYEYDSSSSIYGTSPATQNGDKEITIQVSSSSGTNNFNTEKNFDSTTIASYKTGNYYTLVKGATIESLGSLTTQNINITAKYYNLNISQSSLEGKSFTGKIYVTNNSCKVEKSTSISVTTLMSTSTASVYDENGMRYEGANPNNYVCLDNKTNGACSDSSLQFRIIGLFDVEYSEDGTNSAGTKKLLKVIDTNYYGGGTIAWNASSTQSTSNNSNSINLNTLNSKIRYDIISLANIDPIAKSKSNWNNASLKVELNSTYLTNILNLSTVNSKLSSIILNAKWHLYGPATDNYKTMTVNDIYDIERISGATHIQNPSSIYAQVGLIYASDYGYATTGGTTTDKSACESIPLHDLNYTLIKHKDCTDNNWLFSNVPRWLITPLTDGFSSLYLESSGLYSNNVAESYYAYPTFYLDAEAIKIVGGTGTSTDPYHIG